MSVWNDPRRFYLKVTGNSVCESLFKLFPYGFFDSFLLKNFIDSFLVHLKYFTLFWLTKQWATKVCLREAYPWLIATFHTSSFGDSLKPVVYNDPKPLVLMCRGSEKSIKSHKQYKQTIPHNQAKFQRINGLPLISTNQPNNPDYSLLAIVDSFDRRGWEIY